MFINFFFPETRAVYQIMWQNMVERDRPQMTIWRMRISRWIPKATNTLIVCKTYCFFTTKMVTRTYNSLTLYVRPHSRLKHSITLLLRYEFMWDLWWI